MNPQSRSILPLLMILGCCIGCAHTHYQLRIPLSDDPAAATRDAAHVVIEDARPARERKTHLGKDIWGCERWFGDETFQPAKLVHLETLIAERVSSNLTVRMRLDRFDTVEYCQNSGNPGGSAAARNSGAGVLPNFEAGAEIGDSVVLRVAGTVNGLPFDVTRTFDYGNLDYAFPNTASSHWVYRALMRDRFEQLADDIVNRIPGVTQ